MDSEKASVFILRVSLSIVFLWFGVDKLLNPEVWFMWVPQSLQSLVESNLYAFMYMLGALEVSIGITLLLGFFVRVAAITASVLLTLIILTSGVAPVVRDIGLLGISVYLAMSKKNVKPITSYFHVAKPLLVFLVALSLFSLSAFVASYTEIDNNLSIPFNNQKNYDEFSLAPTGLDSNPLMFVKPTKDQVIQVGDLEVLLEINFDWRRVGANHVHFKLNGKIVDAVYLDLGSNEVRTVLRILEPGVYHLEASIARIDHTEISGYETSVSFVVKG